MKHVVWLVFVACSSAPIVIDAGVDAGVDAGSVPRCSGDTECPSLSICHPTAHVCVAQCMSSFDCPLQENDCPVAAGDGGASVCQCVSSGLCNSVFPGSICAAFDRECVNRCGSSADCPDGRACDVASGDCAPP